VLTLIGKRPCSILTARGLMKPSDYLWCLLLVFVFSACTTTSHSPNTGSGGAPVAGHGAGGSGGHGSGGSGGAPATDAGKDSGTDAAAGMCAQPSESCLTTPCCAGLQCCSGMPIPQGEAHCFGGLGGCPMSDYHVKAGFSAVESDAVLDGLLALPLSKWHYKSEPAEVQHIGPMAQDFKATFGVGADDEHIFQVDADGVSYAAIQALARRIATLSAQQAALSRDNAALREQVQRLESRTDCR
jgi:hypothetical protein